MRTDRQKHMHTQMTQTVCAITIAIGCILFNAQLQYLYMYRTLKSGNIKALKISHHQHHLRFDGHFPDQSGSVFFPWFTATTVYTVHRISNFGNQPYNVPLYNDPRWHFALSTYVAIATKPVHQLQIRPIAHNYGALASPTIPSSYIRVRAVVWECGEGQTDTQTHRVGWPTPQYTSLGYA